MEPVLQGLEEGERRALEACVPGGKPVRALEWGSSDVTFVLASRLPAGSRWISVEHDRDRFARVQARLTEGGTHDAFCVPGAPDGADELERFREYVFFPAGLRRRFDLVWVSGPARVPCAQLGWMLLDAHGALVCEEEPGRSLESALPAEALKLRIGNGRGFTIATRDRDVLSAVTRALRGDAKPVVSIGAARTPKPAPTPSAASGPRIVFVNTYYAKFLEQHYRARPSLVTASYEEQKAALQARLFGDSDFYSRGFAEAGFVADDLVINCEPLQRQWARQAGVSASGLEVALEQIRRAKPDVLYLQDLGMATHAFLAAVRPHVGVIAGQNACPTPATAHLPGFDVLFTSFPHFVERYRQAGVAAYYQPLAFEPRVLPALGPDGALGPGGAERPLPVTFVGGIANVHTKANQLLDQLARAVPIEFYGYGYETLPSDSPVRARHRGEAWGDDMFRLLARSRITINRHSEAAETFANNMRLFEATGCGALLVTDHKDNLDELFEIGREVVAYRSPEECVALVQYYLAHPDEAAAIARAGQRRTLRDHTYGARMRDSAEILRAHVTRKKDSARFAGRSLGVVSTGYTNIQVSQVSSELVDAWKDGGLPEKQRTLVCQELGELYGGRTPLNYEVLAHALRPIHRAGDKLLEVGCSSGYYNEVLRYLLGRPVDYTGVDYSAAMIDMARAYYPNTPFQVADGGALPFEDGAFELVVSSGVLLHVPEYPAQIREAARVSKRYVLAHRTPVCRRRATTFQRKQGYGVDMVEIIFNERELLDRFASHGLVLTEALQFHANDAADEYGVTYVWRKQS